MKYECPVCKRGYDSGSITLSVAPQCSGNNPKHKQIDMKEKGHRNV